MIAFDAASRALNLERRGDVADATFASRGLRGGLRLVVGAVLLAVDDAFLPSWVESMASSSMAYSSMASPSVDAHDVRGSRWRRSSS